MSEYHLLIIWSKAVSESGRIIADLSEKFEMVKVVEIDWGRQKFYRNLCRFYGDARLILRYKQFHCGAGPFIMIIVRDQKPEYDTRVTTKGKSLVNTRIFDAKTLYRSWTGGGHRIHGTNSAKEFLHDFTLLTGWDTTVLEKISYWNGKTESLNQGLTGCHGWESIGQLFQVLSKTCEYVVLRNFEGLPDQYEVNEHGDIDLLAENLARIVRIASAKRTHCYANRVCFTVRIDGKDVPFDIRHVGDGYYDTKWEKDILANRRQENDFYTPDAENLFYSLIYHALVHKRSVAEDYKEQLGKMYKELFPKETFEDPIPALVQALEKFMSFHGYEFVEANDQTVHFNNQYTGRAPRSLMRKYFIPIYRKMSGKQ